jgi:hypothetical protein
MLFLPLRVMLSHTGVTLIAAVSHGRLHCVAAVCLGNPPLDLDITAGLGVYQARAPGGQGQWWGTARRLVCPGGGWEVASSPHIDVGLRRCHAAVMLPCCR